MTMISSVKASCPGRRALPLALAAVLALGSCHPAPPPPGAVPLSASRETVVVDSQITRMGVRTAWDVVRLVAPRLRYALDATGQPTGVRTEERRSVEADQTPLLVVDGARSRDILYLNQIPASEVRRLRIIDGDVAMSLFGFEASSGAIVVETKRGS
jgi:hypothetical protein